MNLDQKNLALSFGDTIAVLWIICSALVAVTDWAFTVQKVIDKLSNIEIVVPGHGKLGNAELLTHTIKLARKANSDNSIQPTADASVD